jgi:hypothetical protein
VVCLVSGASQLRLGSVPFHLWFIFVVLALTRLALNLDKLKRNGRSLMKTMTNTLSFTLTGLAEMVWDIGIKVAAAL